MAECRVTMSALRERYAFLIRQIQEVGLFLLQTMQRLLKITVNPIPGAVTTEVLTAFRNTLIDCRTNEEVYVAFHRAVDATYPQMAELIELTAETFVAFTVSGNIVDRTPSGHLVTDPTRRLYTFMLRVLYEKPILALVADDIHGSRFEIIRSSLEAFVSESIRIKVKTVSNPAVSVDAA
jgi:hypothetical protein